MIILAHRDSTASVVLSSSPLLLSLAILQYIYEKSVHSTLVSVNSSSQLHSTYFVESHQELPIITLFHKFININLKAMGYKIITCLLHIPLGQQIYIQ